MSVNCSVSQIDLDGDHGSVPSVCVRCDRCEHETRVYGRSDASVRRGLVTLRRECPLQQTNYYVADWEGY